MGNKYKIKTLAILVAVVFMGGIISVNAQQTVQGTPWTGTQGITLTVDQIMSMERPQGPLRLHEQREHDVPLHKRPNPDAPAVSSYPSFVGSTERGGGIQTNATQAIGASWTGVTYATSGGWVPPDCNGAAGPTQILTCANTRIQVYSKAGVLGALNADLNTFFSTVRNNSGISDTHIRYDRLSQRWIVVGINVANSNNRVCIAVSSGPTITGAASFTFYFFQFNTVTPAGNTNQFFDYPTLGVDANALYIGGNCFGGSFTGSIMFVVRKSSVTSGGPIVATAFRTLATASSGIYTPQGVDNDDPNATEGYFVGTDASLFSRLNIVRISNPGGAPTGVALTPLTVPTTVNPIGQVSSGTTNRLDAIDDRPFAAMMMKDKLTGVSTLWTAHNIQVNSSGVASSSGGRNGSRWYQLGNMTSTPTLVQSGTLYDPAASNMRGYWIPSVAMSGQGHALLGSSTASAANFADVAVAGRYNCDALGTLQPAVVATTSTTAYNRQGGTQRWGDYSQVVVDPNDNMTMWTFQEYCDAASDWAVRVVQLKAPTPPPTASLNVLPSVSCSNSVLVNIVANSQPNCTGFFDPGADAGGPGFSNHISATATGGIIVISTTFVDAAHVNLLLNTSASVAGTYTITITNPDGQTTTIPITVTAGANAGTISGTTPLCTSATATFTSSGNGGGTWTSSNSTIASVNSSTGVVTALSIGTSNIIYTVNGCGNPASSSMLLTVTQGVNAGTVSGATPLCVGGTATYTTTGSGGSWISSSATVATVNSSTGFVSAIAAGTTNITYSITSGCGSPASSFSTLTVSPNVTAGTVSGTSPLCIAATSAYTSNGTIGGTWSSSNTAIASVVSGTGVVTSVASGTTSIIYTITGCGGPISSLKVLTVSPNVTAGTISGTSPLCITATSTYSSNGTTGGTWSSSNTAVATVGITSGIVRALTAGTTSIVYTVSSGCGSPVTSLSVLTVSPNITAGTISGTTPLCIGSTTAYSTSGTTGGTWSSSNTSIATVVSGTGVLTAVTSGTSNIIYTVSGCGGTVSALRVLTVSPNVTAGTVSGTSPLCINATASYISNGTTGGTWSSSNTTIATVGSASGIVRALTAGTANIVYTVTSGCGNPVSSGSVLTVNPNVTAGTVSGISPLCIGATAAYTTNGTAGGTWSSSNTSIAVVASGTGVVTAVTSGTTNISYTVTGCGGPVSAFQVLTVSQNPTAGTVNGTPTTICIGANTTYNSNGTAGGTWSSSNGAVATVGVSGVVTGLSNGTSNIIYTVTGCNGVYTASLSVTVSPNPTAGVVSGTPTIICIGANTTYGSNGTAGGTWSSSNAAVATVDVSGVVAGLSNGTSDIIYTVTGCNGPYTASMSVTVSANPTVGVVSGTPTTICIGANTNYSSNGTAGGTWSSSNTTVATVDASGVVNGLSEGTADIVYSITGCNGPFTASLIVTVSANPTAGVVSGTPNAICIGANTTYSSNGTTGGTWSSSNTTVATVDASGIVTGLSEGTADIVYSITGCNGPYTASLGVTVSPNPTAGEVSGTPTTICIGANTNYGSNGTAGGTWSSSNTTVATVDASGVVTGLSEGTTNIVYTVTSGCNGPYTAFLGVTINANPSAGIVSGTPTTICIGAITTYNSDGTAGGTWSSSNTAVATVDASGVVTGASAGTAEIVYTVTTGCNVPFTASLVITVSPDANAGVVSGNSELCSSATAQYNSSGDAGGVWSSGNSAVASVDGAGVATGVGSGTTDIVYTVTSGCNSPVSTGFSLTVNNCTMTLNLTIFIEGYYLQTYYNSGSSPTPMNNNGFGGCLFVNGISPNATDVDTVRVTLMNPTTHLAAGSSTGILQTNGALVVTFEGISLGDNYYLKVTHRNAIETWSATPVQMNISTDYDFTDAAGKAFGSNMGQMPDGKWAFWSGDVSDENGPPFGLGIQDGVIEAGDYVSISNAVDQSSFGYVVTDITGDKLTEDLDYSIIENNVVHTIHAFRPW